MHDRHTHTGRWPVPQTGSDLSFPAVLNTQKSLPTIRKGKVVHCNWRARLHGSVRSAHLCASSSAIAPFMCEVAGSTVLESSARAQTAARSEAVDRFAKFIEEASGRFAVPARWIRAVMQVESSGDEHAISSRGAMGLMQLMPGTWVELSVRYGLGLDPFDPHDNILAGAAYLKDMYDRFGSAGFLAAYHAGPARYEQHLTTGQPLPQETMAYVAAVTPLLGDEHAEHAAVRIRRAVPWQEAPLFVERTEAR